VIITRVPLASLIPDPANARLHPERNLQSIIDSLRRFGQAEPLVVQAGTHRIIAGNGRHAAMKSLGYTECDVVEIEVDDLTATALGIAMNRTADLAEWDEPALAKLLQDLQAEDAIEGVGFTSDELAELLAGLTNEMPDVPQDDVPGLAGDAVSRLGDIWLLGRHRLMCGDSSSAEEVDRLLAGAPIHLVNADAPYNVKVEPRSNNAIAAGLSSFTGTHHQGLDLARHPGKAKATHDRLRPKDRPLANDFVSDEEFDRLLRAWFGNASRVLLPGRGFYLWGGFSNCANYPSAIAESGLYFSQAIIWVKDHPVLTRKDFMTGHEWCFYGWKIGAAHQFYGPANVVDVWNVKKLHHTQTVHLTEKPVELAVRAMSYSSREGEHVLDLFGGSGSTMAAAEQTGRKAFLMELDPLYCDVIVQRLQKLTGEPGRLESSGETFAAVAKERGVALEEVPA
jgi:DNA modification methylase